MLMHSSPFNHTVAVAAPAFRVVIICFTSTYPYFTHCPLVVFPPSEWTITSASKTITTTPEDGDRVRYVLHLTEESQSVTLHAPLPYITLIFITL